jgi:hypothetical protein
VTSATGPRFHACRTVASRRRIHSVPPSQIVEDRQALALRSRKLRNVPSPGGHPVLEVEARVLVHCIRSKLADNVAQPNPQRLGDSQKGINGNRPFRPLHLANVNGVKVGLFSQFFLAETRLFPIFANIVANQSAVLWILRHSPLPKQNAGARSHKLTALVFSVGARTKGDCCAFKRRQLFLLWEVSWIGQREVKASRGWLSSLKLAPRCG